MKPIVFLDIDGVLNSGRFYRQRAKEGRRADTNELCPRSIRCLNHLLKSADADVVVSSTWRFEKGIDQILETAGVEMQGRFRGITPDLSRHQPSGLYTAVERGHEIQAWMNQNGFTGAFVILDDDADMAHLRPHLVKTDNREGLTVEDVNLALAMLQCVRL